MSEYCEELHVFERIEELTSELKSSYQSEINELRQEIVRLKSELELEKAGGRNEQES